MKRSTNNTKTKTRNKSKKTIVKERAFSFLSEFGDGISSKLDNMCKKVGKYDVPSELYQKRTGRSNRVLISWRTVKNNKLTKKQLETFKGGVVINFINNDYFDKSNNKSSLFKFLKARLGSNETISSIISIKSEGGSSSSSIQNEAFEKLINNTKVNYRGKEIVINENNYKNYAIKQRKIKQGKGNNTWSGFLYVSVKGGSQDNSKQTHKGKELTLFNPACEYASDDVCLDINLVMSYFALLSIDKKFFVNAPQKEQEYLNLIKDLEHTLLRCKYNNKSYCGNLLEYVKKHPSAALVPGQLTDPIQIIPITIDKFNLCARAEDSVDFTHDEAVDFELYYWDKNKRCVLSPARPTNIFWSYHYSNMMQQNYNLDTFYKLEDERYINRHNLMD